MSSAPAGRLQTFEAAPRVIIPHLEIVQDLGDTPATLPPDRQIHGLMDRLETPKFLERTPTNARFFFGDENDPYMKVTYHNSATVVSMIALHSLMQSERKERGLVRRLSLLEVTGVMRDQLDLLNPEDFLGTDNIRPREHHARLRTVDESGATVVFTRSIKDIYALTVAPQTPISRQTL